MSAPKSRYDPQRPKAPAASKAPAAAPKRPRVQLARVARPPPPSNHTLTQLLWLDERNLWVLSSRRLTQSGWGGRGLPRVARPEGVWGVGAWTSGLSRFACSIGVGWRSASGIACAGNPSPPSDSRSVAHVVQAVWVLNSMTR